VVTEVIESSIARGRSPDDFARTTPGFHNLSSSATDEGTNNQKLERAGNSCSPDGPGLRKGDRFAVALLFSPPVAG